MLRPFSAQHFIPVVTRVAATCILILFPSTNIDIASDFFLYTPYTYVILLSSCLNLTLPRHLSRMLMTFSISGFTISSTHCLQSAGRASCADSPSIPFQPSCISFIYTPAMRSTHTGWKSILDSCSLEYKTAAAPKPAAALSSYCLSPNFFFYTSIMPSSCSLSILTLSLS